MTTGVAHDVKVTRVKLGTTAIAPARALFGTVADCSCGARWRCNEAPSKGGRKLAAAFASGHAINSETAAPYFDRYGVPKLLMWSLAEVAADRTNFAGLRAALQRAADVSVGRDRGSHAAACEGLDRLAVGDVRGAAASANETINRWSTGFPPAARPALPD